ncbi:bacteriocin immunity protein [Pseudomonas protegens]|uniref:bacteriocin immunity protein n=1 Tax=Pseudomonas protegens TaxID=380021 RepID=UPI0029371C95|nr:bacteriocin immunity protein [Pseudomonas protegens]WOE82645.1 bacteriocin immunity protein [Pseudomonas protegens]
MRATQTPCRAHCGRWGSVRRRKLSGHPDGYDLIFHPEPGAYNSAEGVSKTVKETRVSIFTWALHTAWAGSRQLSR